MKTVLIITMVLVGLFAIIQIYLTMATSNTETQDYKVIRSEKLFDIRYYPAVIMAKIFSTSKSYRELSSSGFGTLAKYIFGGNGEKKQISMTSPVHMEIGDSLSSMSFVMPSQLKKEDLPKPNNAEIIIETSEPQYVAAIGFGGFGTTESINKYKAILENELKDRGLTYYGNFRYLGYNPPYQLFGRRNEVIVTLDSNTFK